LAGHGHGGADIVVRSSFHSHVFSLAWEHSGGAYFLDESQNRRTFCPDRHAKSFALPQMCTDMVEQNHLTWISHDKNKVSNLAVIGDDLITGQHYVVVYYLFPSRSEAFDVELVVKSAYEKYVDFSHIKRRFKTVQQIKTCYYQQKKVP